jgi:hypothetical protein
VRRSERTRAPIAIQTWRSILAWNIALLADDVATTRLKSGHVPILRFSAQVSSVEGPLNQHPPYCTRLRGPHCHDAGVAGRRVARRAREPCGAGPRGGRPDRAPGRWALTTSHQCQFSNFRHPQKQPCASCDNADDADDTEAAQEHTAAHRHPEPAQVLARAARRRRRVHRRVLRQVPRGRRRASSAHLLQRTHGRGLTRLLAHSVLVYPYAFAATSSLAAGAQAVPISCDISAARPCTRARHVLGCRLTQETRGDQNACR